MGRKYIIQGENLTMGTGSVLAAFQTAANMATAGGLVRLMRCEVTQSGSNTAAQIRLALCTRDTAGTLTVTAATPAPLFIGGPASGIAGGTSPLTAAKSGVASSADSGGTYTTVWPINPNNINGWLWLPTPDEQLWVPPSTVLVAKFLTAPGTLTGWTVAMTFEEMF